MANRSRQAALVSGPVLGESKLPSGPPADRGVSLDDSIPGQNTFAKPEGESREPSKDDESIYRVDDADDLTKEQGRGDEIDHSHASPAYNGLGDSDGTSKTKYPYRDGIPNRHSSEQAEYVAGLYRLRTAHEMFVPAVSRVRVAAKVSDILDGLSRQVQQKAAKCTAKLAKVEPKNLRWTVAVNCGNGVRVVRIKAVRPSANVVKVAKMDLVVSCSCPAWQWLGPEYHAKGKGYLERGPVGTASTPDIRDPERKNLVCKHVAAALAVAKGWQVDTKRPGEKQASGALPEDFFDPLSPPTRNRIQMPTYAIECHECGAAYDQRLSYAQYDEVKTQKAELPCTQCGKAAIIAFKPSRVGFVLKEGESGGWASKSIKENAYRAERSKVMAKRNKDHVFKSSLQANYDGTETGSWRDAQELARKEKGDLAAATYEPLVQKEKAKPA
jgi:predicted nucleic acid-binding Zn ribbon protein